MALLLEILSDYPSAQNHLEDHHRIYVFALSSYRYPDPDIPPKVLVIDDCYGERQVRICTPEDVDRHWHPLTKTYWAPGRSLEEI